MCRWFALSFSTPVVAGSPLVAFSTGQAIDRMTPARASWGQPGAARHGARARRLSQFTWRVPGCRLA
jgi:hypothetical protein